MWILVIKVNWKSAIDAVASRVKKKISRIGRVERQQWRVSYKMPPDEVVVGGGGGGTSPGRVNTKQSREIFTLMVEETRNSCNIKPPPHPHPPPPNQQRNNHIACMPTPNNS
jgi:hypothetical protein